MTAAQRISLQFDALADSVVVVSWDDPVVDSIGHDVRSEYVELFWLNVLGPTSTWLLRRLVRGLERHPLGYELDLWETARALGLAYTPGTTSPFLRALHRCALFGVVQPFHGAIAVRRRLPPVTGRQLSRMPPGLRDAHPQWGEARTAERDDTRATLLARAMQAAGDDPDQIERQLLALGVAPALASAHSEQARPPASVAEHVSERHA
jgi:hypothetical protein